MSTPAESFWAQPEAAVPVDLELRYDDLLDRAAAAVPDREAIVFLAEPPESPARITYRELAGQTEQAAKALLASGVTRGSTIALYAPNRPEFAVLQFACARIGAALAPVNPAYGPDDLEYVLRVAGASVCFAQRQFRAADLSARVRTAAAGLPGLRSVVWLGPDSGKSGDSAVPISPEPGDLTWSAWLAAGDAVSDEACAAAQAAAEPGDVIEKMFTSGTTGRPKGVRIRGSAMANGGRLIAERCGFEDGMRMVHAMPFFHCGGTVCCMAASQAVRGTAIFPPAFSPAVMVAAADAEGATAIGGVPTMLIALDQAAEEHQMRGVRTVLTGGALLPEALAEHWTQRYGVSICNTFGMTELAASATLTAPDDPVEHRYTTVGRPLPGVSADVVVPGTDKRVPFGTEGEIRLGGWGTMESYEGDPEATAAALSADGWMRTGDLGSLTPDGYVRVTGRLKDLIVRGGENISPAAVEDAVRAAVPEILDLSVVGVPDDYYGEAVALFVRLRDGEGGAGGEAATLSSDDIRDRIAGVLPRYQVPAHIRIVGEFPMTPSGKIQKYRLREQFIAED